jgi:hypothetical protein
MSEITCIGQYFRKRGLVEGVQLPATFLLATSWTHPQRETRKYNGISSQRVQCLTVSGHFATTWFWIRDQIPCQTTHRLYKYALG